jgi:hypothetical protein
MKKAIITMLLAYTILISAEIDFLSFIMPTSVFHHVLLSMAKTFVLGIFDFVVLSLVIPITFYFIRQVFFPINRSQAKQ